MTMSPEAETIAREMIADSDALFEDHARQVEAKGEEMIVLIDRPWKRWETLLSDAQNLVGSNDGETRSAR